MRAILLCAGLGTRLGALSDERPKPLLPIADIPILRYGLALLAGHGFREVAINLHHRGELIVAELDGMTSMSITWSREETILGTGGALKKMGGWLTRGGREPFLVMNGKLILDVDLGALVERHLRRGPLATLVVREVSDAARWGAIDVDGDDRVVGILETAAPTGARRTMFTGVHVVSPDLLTRLPDGESCTIRQGYLPALRAGASIDALLYNGYFQEHSTPERYLAGNRALLSGEARLRFPPGELTGVHPTAMIGKAVTLVAPYRIGPDAHIGDGATIGPFTTVGARAEIAAGAVVRNSIVWPSAHLSGTIARSIVTRASAISVD